MFINPWSSLTVGTLVGSLAILHLVWTGMGQTTLKWGSIGCVGTWTWATDSIGLGGGTWFWHLVLLELLCPGILQLLHTKISSATWLVAAASPISVTSGSLALLRFFTFWGQSFEVFLACPMVLQEKHSKLLSIKVQRGYLRLEWPSKLQSLQTRFDIWTVDYCLFKVLVFMRFPWVYLLKRTWEIW
jgi:hypothetical protein